MKSEETKNIGLRGITIADTHISMVDGENGKLFYRGYPIGQLAEQASFEEVICLLLYGSAPARERVEKVQNDLREYRQLPAEVLEILGLFKPSAAPMDVMQSMAAALAQFDPDLQTDSREAVGRSCLRLIAQLASVAAAWQRIRTGAEPVRDLDDSSHAAAFLNGMWGRVATPEETRLMDLLLVLHADHTFNASTFAVREVASTRANLYASVSAGIGALSGDLHGRAKLLEKKNLVLFPNVDFFSSPVLYGQGFPIDMFPVFFAVSRVSGWCAHFLEEHFAEAQPKPALYRPEASYTGRMCSREGCSWPDMNSRDLAPER